MDIAEILNFRYAVLTKLGEGGSGEVFLVQDLLDEGRQSALKVLFPTGHDPGSEDSFGTEVSTLLGLHHPNLIRIQDFGRIRHCHNPDLLGRNFFTMEYLRGKDALTWIAGEKGTHVDELLLRLLLQCLDALAYIHRMGVIHFDIKPQNLIVLDERESPDQPVVKIVDFGLSAKIQDIAKNPVRGTLEFSAPELLRGESIDHRIDLYSLGVSFFCLLEGHCPFEADDPVELIKKILSEPIVLPERNSEAGSTVRRSVLSLTSKDRDIRPASAHREAIRLLSSASTLSKGHSFRVLKPRFSGRGKEKAIALDSMKRLSEGQQGAGTIVIRGAEGIGKSALLAELTMSARAQGLHVFETGSTSGVIPFHDISRFLRLLLSEAQSVSDEGRRIAARYRSLLGDDGGAKTAPGSGDEFRIEQRSRFIVECGRVFPFVIVADDFDRMDLESALVLRTTARDMDRSQTLILVAEESDAGEQQGWEAGQTEIILGNFSEQDVREMVGSLFGMTESSGEISSTIFRLYGGSPGLTVEALQTLASSLTMDDLQQPEEARRHLATLEENLPSRVDDYLFRKYSALTSDQRILVEVLSCFSGPARTDILLALPVLSGQRIRPLSGALEATGLVGSTQDGNRVFVGSSKLRSMIAARLGHTRQNYHGLIASGLEALSDPAIGDLEETGFQYGELGDTGKASLFLARAADLATESFAFNHAAELLRRAVALCMAPSDDPARWRVLQVKLIKALFHSGKDAEAITYANELLEDSGLAGAERGEVLSLSGFSESRLGNYSRARTLITEAMRYVTKEVEMIRLHQELASIDINSGNFKAAERSCLEQLEKARSAGSKSLIAGIQTDLGISTFMQGRYGDAISFFRASMDSYEEEGDQRRVADAMNNIANALNATGDTDQAIHYWTRALKASESHSTLNRQGEIRNNLGIAHYSIRHYEEAKRYYDEAQAIFRRIGSLNGLAYTMTNLGEVFLAEGDYEEALLKWGEARGLYDEMEDLQGLAETDLQLAQVWLILGDEKEVESGIAAAEQRLNRDEHQGLFGWLLLVKGMLENRRRSPARAEEYLADARPLVEAGPSRERVYLCLLALAEAYTQQKNDDEAVAILQTIQCGEDLARFPHVAGRAFLMLSELSGARAGLLPGQPIGYLRSGMEVMETAPVSETTWELMFALAQQLQKRGQVGRAEEYLTKATLVLKYFMSKFRSAPLRALYANDQVRRRVLSGPNAFSTGKDQSWQ